jgi:hypothetical protein
MSHPLSVGRVGSDKVSYRRLLAERHVGHVRHHIVDAKIRYGIAKAVL